MSTDRTIRVFISSTFRDMQAERDYLVKFTFPQLRKLCESRGVTWAEVDLRWGITDEEKAEGKVLPLCLEEIHRCRPYFIGLLGERYGWIPEGIPPEVIERELWLREHLNERRSVTELEILHGVLNNPEMANHAFFYFRDAKYVEQVSPEDRNDFIPEDEESTEKLKDLKERIRHNPFPVRENYANPKALGELVLKDFTELIERLYPAGEEPGPLDREALDHEAFAQSRTRVYIGRQEYFDRLDEHVQSDGPPLVVLGESGSGKSALLANWSAKYREKHPDAFVLQHYIGATPYSADWAAMLRRIMGEFRRRFDIQQDIPDKPDELRAAFANWLHMVAAKGKVVLILDALNQLEARDGAPDLVWLPPDIPAGIRLVVSALTGRSLDNLSTRAWPTLEIKSLGTEERKQLITEYLAQYTKALSPARAEDIVSAEQTANPLFLRALLDELRVFGFHEQLDERIKYYLAAVSVERLYEKILERYEQDYERERPGLVHDAMTMLWAARQGLSEAELLDLLGTRDGPLPRAYWSPLYISVEQSLVNRSGLISFGHEHLRSAIRIKYLATHAQERESHLKLAFYFDRQPVQFEISESQLEPIEAEDLPRDLAAMFSRRGYRAFKVPINKRKIAELPWQLAHAHHWLSLYGQLANLPFLQAAWDQNKFDVEAYWASVEEHSELRMVRAYEAIIKDPVVGPAVIDPVKGFTYVPTIASLLYETGHFPEGMSLFAFLAAQARKTDDQAQSLRLLGNQALALEGAGDFQGAMRLHKEQEAGLREINDQDGLSRCLGNQAGNLLQTNDDREEATRLLKEQERICRLLVNKDGLSRCLNNQSLVYFERGDLDTAMAQLREAEHLARELGNKDVLSGSLGNQARIMKRRGDLESAFQLFQEQGRLCNEIGDRFGAQQVLGEQAEILETRNDLKAALLLYEDQARLCRKLRDNDYLQSALHDQARILYSLDDLEGATRVQAEMEQNCRELNGKYGLSRLFGHTVLSFPTGGALKKQLSLLEDREQFCRAVNNPEGLVIALANQAWLIFSALEDSHHAFPAAKEAYEIAEAHGLTAKHEYLTPLVEQIVFAHAGLIKPSGLRWTNTAYAAGALFGLVFGWLGHQIVDRPLWLGSLVLFTGLVAGGWVTKWVISFLIGRHAKRSIGLLGSLGTLVGALIGAYLALRFRHFLFLPVLGSLFWAVFLGKFSAWVAYTGLSAAHYREQRMKRER